MICSGLTVPVPSFAVGSSRSKGFALQVANLVSNVPSLSGDGSKIFLEAGGSKPRRLSPQYMMSARNAWRSTSTILLENRELRTV